MTLVNLFGTQDGKQPEIFLHSDYMSWFTQNKIPFKAWGSSGPDFLLRQYNVIGEVKKENTPALLKSAIQEIYARTKSSFRISQFSGFFVIAGPVIRYYTQTDKKFWQDVDLQDCLIFEEKHREVFLDFLKGKAHKVSVENHLDFVLDFLLDEKFNMCISDGLRLLFNLDNPNRAFVKRGIYFNPGEENELLISLNCNQEAKTELLNFLNIFTISDVEKVKDYIKHNYSSHLPDTKKANLGKYYTPKEIVETLRTEIVDKIREDTHVMDLACGCGAFLELFDDCHIVGRDIDEQAIEILDLFNFSNIGVDNSLLHVSRQKYGLSDQDDLIIIGNPPYNDTSSINKRYSTKAKSKRNPEDADIHCRDIGRSFLEAYAKLCPRYICVLHPLSFLIKKVNFNSMKRLRSHYVLENAVIFKSSVFKDLYGGTPFPIVIATYRYDEHGMDYDFIKNFIFTIYGSSQRFSLRNIEQAGHDYIHQTVTSRDLENDSDIGLYHYNFRDINSLNKANFQNEDYRTAHHDTMIVVNYDDLWKYCYVNCIKKFLLPMLTEGNYYILGNLNPIIDKELINSSPHYWKDLFVACAILKNSHRIDCMSIEDKKNNMLTQRFILNDFKKRSRQPMPNGNKNFYKAFLDYVDCASEKSRNIVYECVIQYFDGLIKKCLI